MSFKCYVLLIQLPLLLWACGSDLAGTPSKSAEFGLSFFAPLAYTYPPNGVTAAAKQSVDEGIVNNLVKTDLNVAIGKGLTANQIYLYVPPTLNISFTPQAMEIEDDDECTTDGKYLAQDGTVYYKCVTVSTLRARVVREAGDPDPTTSTADPTTEANDGSTVSPGTPTIRTVPFSQTMTVTATASQPLYENQWNAIGRSVQQALEAKKLVFDDELQVVIL